jgi:hypothetical protein
MVPSTIAGACARLLACFPVWQASMGDWVTASGEQAPCHSESPRGLLDPTNVVPRALRAIVLQEPHPYLAPIPRTILTWRKASRCVSQ